MNYTEEYIEIINEPKRTIYRCKICDFLSVSDKLKFETHLKSTKHFKKINNTTINKNPDEGFHSYVDIVECQYCDKQQMKYGYYMNIHSKTSKHLKKVEGISDMSNCDYCGVTYGNSYMRIHKKSKKHINKVKEHEEKTKKDEIITNK